MKTRVVNSEVLYPDESVIRVGHQDIEWLKQESDKNARKRIRLCTHISIEDPVHEMLIVHAKNTYVRPHKHLNKTESFHIVDGLVDIVLYTDDGLINEVIPMGDYGTGRNFYYRLSEPIFHTMVIVSDHLVFHETTCGPFRASDTMFAPWAPDESDSLGVKAFMYRLAQEIEAEHEV